MFNEMIEDYMQNFRTTVDSAVANCLRGIRESSTIGGDTLMAKDKMIEHLVKMIQIIDGRYSGGDYDIDEHGDVLLPPRMH